MRGSGLSLPRSCVPEICVYSAVSTDTVQVEPGQSREIHLHPRLIPGHSYLGVRTDPFNASYYFIETTMIG